MWHSIIKTCHVHCTGSDSNNCSTIVVLHTHRLLSSTQSVRQAGVRIKDVIDVMTEMYLAAILP